MSRSGRIYLTLVLSWLLIDLGFFLLPPETIPEGQQIDSSRLLLDIVLASVGFLALKAAERSGFEKLWSLHLSAKERFAAPVATGLLLGIVPAAVDYAASIGDIHADFPVSLLNYYVGGLFSEVMFRLIPLGLLVWLVANKMLGARWQTTVFWIVALAVGLYEPLAAWQIMTDPSVPGGFESGAAAFGFVATAYALNVLAAYFFWTRGFLAAVVLRWSFYVIWHIAWPVLYY
jgi:hypothetical protein